MYGKEWCTALPTHNWASIYVPEGYMGFFAFQTPNNSLLQSHNMVRFSKNRQIVELAHKHSLLLTRMATNDALNVLLVAAQIRNSSDVFCDDRPNHAFSRDFRVAKRNELIQTLLPLVNSSMLQSTRLMCSLIFMLSEGTINEARTFETLADSIFQACTDGHVTGWKNIICDATSLTRQDLNRLEEEVVAKTSCPTLHSFVAGILNKFKWASGEIQLENGGFIDLGERQNYLVHLLEETTTELGEMLFGLTGNHEVREFMPTLALDQAVRRPSQPIGRQSHRTSSRRTASQSSSNRSTPRSTPRSRPNRNRRRTRDRLASNNSSHAQRNNRTPRLRQQRLAARNRHFSTPQAAQNRVRYMGNYEHQMTTSATSSYGTRNSRSNDSDFSIDFTNNS